MTSSGLRPPKQINKSPTYLNLLLPLRRTSFPKQSLSVHLLQNPLASIRHKQWNLRYAPVCHNHIRQFQRMQRDIENPLAATLVLRMDMNLKNPLQPVPPTLEISYLTGFGPLFLPILDPMATQFTDNDVEELVLVFDVIDQHFHPQLVHSSAGHLPRHFLDGSTKRNST